MRDRRESANGMVWPCSCAASEQSWRGAPKLGLVSSLNHPGGNITGVAQTGVEVAPKELELLHELIPAAHVMALLVNPADSTLAEGNAKEVQAPALTFGLELHVLNASTERDFDVVFAKLIQLQAGGLVIGGDPFFTSRVEQLAALAVRHAVPTIYQRREFAEAGGLMSYGSDIADSYRLAGNYTGRILKSEKPPTCRSRKQPKSSCTST
jgi:putative tryptophan/tyrosine transport system substrate-binding protein